MRRISIYLFSLAFLSWMFLGAGCYLANRLIKYYADKNEMIVEQVKEEKKLAQNDSSTKHDAYSKDSMEDVVMDDSAEEEYSQVSANDNINATMSGIYYLRYVNDEIVVYEQNMNTIYMNTGIDASHLSLDILEQLQEGIWVNSEDELFSLLESYSS